MSLAMREASNSKPLVEMALRLAAVISSDMARDTSARSSSPAVTAFCNRCPSYKEASNAVCLSSKAGLPTERRLRFATSA